VLRSTVYIPHRRVILNQVREVFHFISTIHYCDVLILARMQHSVINCVAWKRVEMSEGWGIE
jgi:hypothetical protein